MALHGDYKDVKGMRSTQACRETVKLDKELSNFKKSPEIKAALKLIRKADDQKKKLKEVILNDLKGVDRLKYEVTVDQRDVDAYSYKLIKVVPTTVATVIANKAAKID